MTWHVGRCLATERGSGARRKPTPRHLSRHGRRPQPPIGACAAFVEGVWFDQAVTGRSYEEIGIPATVDGSFRLRKNDTIEKAQAQYRQRWDTSKMNLADRHSDEIVNGRGARAVWALQLQVLRELAQHTGHADILREPSAPPNVPMYRYGMRLRDASRRA